MTYHDNIVQFVTSGNIELVGGSYTISQHSISSGQDPKNYIKDGTTYNFDASGTMTFKIGRHGTTEVASWFNQRIYQQQNTFGHTADDLNFAFMGTLVLTLTGDGLNNQPQTITIENTGLAQGHAGTSNNWWFGSESGAYVPPNILAVMTNTNSGFPIKLGFQRGNNPVNQITIML